VISRDARRERTACVKDVGIALREEASVKLVGAGFGENFDTPIAESVELR
jgi:hypothetical protein